MSAPPAGKSRLVALDWDTRHFGWPVARLEGDRLADEELSAGLEAARDRGIRLVYWFAAPSCRPADEVVRRHSGRLVDRRVTFRLDGTPGPPRPVATTAETPAGLALAEWPRGDPSTELVSLAVSAGRCSRFARDPRIPRERFTALYESWIRRSTRRDIADTVITASRDGELQGLITVRRHEVGGLIGLVAVAEPAQRRGVGSALLRSAAAWVTRGGGSRLDVVTQLENGPATALYTRAGFTPVDLQHVHHFWPGDAAP